MTDPEDIDVDDLVTQDQLENAIQGAVSDALEDVEPHDHDEETPDHDALFPEDFDPATDLVDPEGARDVADTTFIERMRHLAHEDCDTQTCQDLRNAFGLSPGGAEREPEPDADAGESEEVDESEGEDSDADGSESEPAESDESEPDAETNVFGEPV
jgi:hypothetical protein